MKEWLKKHVSHINDPFKQRKAEYTLISFVLICLYSVLNVIPMFGAVTAEMKYIVVSGIYGLLLFSSFIVFKKNLLVSQYLFILSGSVVAVGYYINDVYFHFYIQIILVLFVHVIIHIKKSQLYIMQGSIIVILIIRFASMNHLFIAGELSRIGLNDHLFMILSVFSLIIFIDAFSKIIEKDISERIYLDAIVDKDALTGLENRESFNRTIDSYHEEDIIYQLAIIDIDFFKDINDQYGHEKGDEILINLSKLLMKSFNHSDFKVFRWGGEEFVLLTTSRKIPETYHLLNAFRKELMEYDFGLKNPLTISIGLSEYDFEQSKERVFSLADDYLYKAKENGRNQIVIKEGVHV